MVVHALTPMAISPMNEMDLKSRKIIVFLTNTNF